MSTTTKDDMVHMETLAADRKVDMEAEEEEPIDRAFERRVVRKVDMQLIPILFLLLIFAFLDRINIGNARIMGLEKDLNMKGMDYNIALFTFFITYILFEVPSNIVLKKVRPSVWLSSLIMGWGIVTICQGFTASFAGLVVCRVLIGALEAGFIPGCVYLISMYYPRFEVQRRLTIQFSGSVFAGAVSGLLAYGIFKMDGVKGYRAWRWVFILEGIATCIFALVALFVIPDWPETARFLKEDERQVLLHRLNVDSAGVKMDRLDKKAMKRILLDKKILFGSFIYLGIGVSNYSVSFFTPTILNDFGWDVLRTQGMSVPVYASAGVMTIVISFISDWRKHRYGFLVGGLLTCMVGYGVLLNGDTVSINARYMALFFMSIGGFVAQPIALIWLSNNMGGHYKRSISAAIQIGFGNCAGFISTNIYFRWEAPTYTTGTGTSLGFVGVAILSATALLIYCILENRKRDRGEYNSRLELPADERDNLGDDHPNFRFIY